MVLVAGLVLLLRLALFAFLSIRQPADALQRFGPGVRPGLHQTRPRVPAGLCILRQARLAMLGQSIALVSLALARLAQRLEMVERTRRRFCHQLLLIQREHF